MGGSKQGRLPPTLFNALWGRAGQGTAELGKCWCVAYMPGKLPCTRS